MGAFALMAIAAGLNIVSGFAQAGNERKIAEFNALQAERDAAIAEAEANEDARRIRHEGRLLRGLQTSQSSASNLTLSGSILDIIADDIMEIELKALDRERQGKIAGQRGREEAGLQRGLGAARAQQSILSGITRAAGIGYSAYESGALGGTSNPTTSRVPIPQRKPSLRTS